MNAMGAKPVRPKVVWALCLGAAGLCTVAHLRWVTAYRDRLPNPVAIHWSGTEADGFSSIDGMLMTQAGLLHR